MPTDPYLDRVWTIVEMAAPDATNQAHGIACTHHIAARPLPPDIIGLQNVSTKLGLENCMNYRDQTGTVVDNALSTKIMWMFTAWAIYSVVVPPIKICYAIAYHKWQLPSGEEIPFFEFPIQVNVFVILSVFARLLMVIAIYRAVKSIVIGDKSTKLLSGTTARSLNRIGTLLLFFYGLDLVSMPIGYLILVAIDARVDFSLGTMAGMALAIPPEKLALSGFAFTCSALIRVGTKLDEELELTV